VSEILKLDNLPSDETEMEDGIVTINKDYAVIAPVQGEFLGKPEEEVKESRNKEAQKLEDGKENVVFQGGVESFKSSGQKERSSVIKMSRGSKNGATNESEMRKENQDGEKNKKSATARGLNQTEVEKNEDPQVEGPQQISQSVVSHSQLKMTVPRYLHKVAVHGILGRLIKLGYGVADAQLDLRKVSEIPKLDNLPVDETELEDGIVVIIPVHLHKVASNGSLGQLIKLGYGLAEATRG
jgi:hypothetical protein